MSDTSLTQGQRLFLVALLYCFVYYFESTTPLNLLQPLLALYYAYAALPKHHDTRALVGLAHLLFGATHTLKVLVLIDKICWHDHQTLLQPTIPLTNLAKENISFFRLVGSASICYIIYKILICFFPGVYLSQDNTPTSNATTSAKTHTISISTQTDDLIIPVHEAQIHLLQASPPPEKDLKQETRGHFIPSSERLLTQEQVDAILSHAKEEQDRNTEQQLSKLKKQIASLNKTVNESSQKMSDHKTFYQRQTRNSQKHFEKLACQAKRRAETAERQLLNTKDGLDDREQTIQSLRILLREKRLSDKSQPSVHVAQDDKIDIELESLRKELKDADSKNQTLSQELEIAKSAPSKQLTKTEEELAAVKASSAEIEAQLFEKTKAFTEFESRLEKAEDNQIKMVANESQWEATKEQLVSKSTAYTELESQFEAVKKELAGMNSTNSESYLEDTKSQLVAKTKANSELESKMKDAYLQLEGKTKAYSELESKLKSTDSQLSSKTKANTELELQLEDTISQLTGKTKANAELESRLKDANETAQQAEVNANAQHDQLVQVLDTKLHDRDIVHQQQMAATRSGLEQDLTNLRQTISNYELEASNAKITWKAVSDGQDNTINKLTTDCSNFQQDLTTQKNAHDARIAEIDTANNATKQGLNNEILRLKTQLEASRVHTDCESTIKRLHDELEPLRDQVVEDAIILPRLKAIAAAIDPHIARFEDAINKRVPVEWLERLFDSITDEYFEEWYDDFVSRDLAGAVPGHHGRASKRGEDNSDPEDPQIAADPQDRPKKALRRTRRTGPADDWTDEDFWNEEDFNSFKK
ncbi:hypothetical protein EG327_004498 [Venturia inaequalis]|uniref:Uncharacterized protein n=1 Tax=Venturia inaequalis TaxID=5025 RepID=A0A8H3ZB49_VENIN|nr:hypothetical protein EG327_004498 [Venturia inaequalis]